MTFSVEGFTILITGSICMNYVNVTVFVIKRK